MFLGFKHFCSDLGIKEGVCRGEFQSQSLCQSQTNFKSMMFLFLFKIKKKKILTFTQRLYMVVPLHH